VAHRDARLFERGAILEHLVLLHPELPKDPMIATVAYVLGSRPGSTPMEVVGVGIQFLSMEPPARASLEAWIDASMASQQN
jgi:glutathione S-transferase